MIQARKKSRIVNQVVEQITKADRNACHVLCSKGKSRATLRRLRSTVLCTIIIDSNTRRCVYLEFRQNHSISKNRKMFKAIFCYAIVISFVLIHGCEKDGIDGQDGLKSLVRIENEPEGTNCIAGGYLVHSGIDLNSNDTLDDNEIQVSEYICHGIDGYYDKQVIIPFIGVNNLSTNSSTGIVSSARKCLILILIIILEQIQSCLGDFHNHLMAEQIVLLNSMIKPMAGKLRILC